jgi:hypothetical protein
MRNSKILSASCVVSCLVLAGIIGGKPSASAAADPAVVLQSGLSVYSGPAESRAVLKHLAQGEEVLTRVEIIDSQGMEWCDVLSRVDETMLGYVRCEGLKILRTEKPENWRVVPSPEEVKSPGSESQKSPAAPKVANPKGDSTAQPAQAKPSEYDPRQLKTY